LKGFEKAVERDALRKTDNCPGDSDLTGVVRREVFCFGQDLPPEPPTE
jgi:hypothetical protein